MKIENNEFVVEVFDGTEIRVNRIDVAELLQPLLEKRAPSGVYVCVKPDEDTKKKIYQFFEDQQIPDLLSPEEYHVTLMYAPEQDLADYIIDENVGTTTAHFDAYDLYGDEKDCLVMKLTSQGLHRIHDQLRAMGLVPTYPEYSPHLTLSYQGQTVDVNKLPAPPFEFRFENQAEVNFIDKDYKKNAATMQEN